MQKIAGWNFGGDGTDVLFPPYFGEIEASLLFLPLSPLPSLLILLPSPPPLPLLFLVSLTTLTPQILKWTELNVFKIK